MEYSIDSLADDVLVESTNIDNEEELSFSDDSEIIMFQMFIKNIYSNPIGSIVREITSNCFDSHVEANVSTPVVIRKHTDNVTNTTYISFIDFGIGMSPERINKVFKVLFKSTKRTDNKQIGGFGVGSKTPLAYRRSTGVNENDYDNTYFINTIYNGIKYYYMIYAAGKKPKFNLLHSEETTEHNGTEVKVPVLDKDIYRFHNELVRQLYYFENIVFEGFEHEILNSDFQIVRAKTFLFRGNEYSSNVHVCLGKVAYPIDYSALGLNSSDYNIPVAIKLEIGDITPNVSREGLEYNDATIKLLKKKLELVKEEIKELLIQQYSNIVTLEDYFKASTKMGYLLFTNGKSINCNGMIAKKDIDLTNFRYNFTKMPDDKTLFNLFFESKVYGKKPSTGRRRRYSDDTNFVGGYQEIQSARNIYYIDGIFERKLIKQAWLKHNHTTYYIINKTYFKFKKEEICNIFNVDIEVLKTVDEQGNPISNPFIENLIKLQDEYYEILKKFVKNYDEIIVPEDYIANRKMKATADIKNFEIPVTIVDSYRDLRKSRMLLKDLFDFRYSIYYGTADDAERMKTYALLFGILFDSTMIVERYVSYRSSKFEKYNSKGGIMFIMVAKNNLKYFQYCKRAKPITEFYDYVLSRKENEVRDFFQSRIVLESFNRLSKLYQTTYFSSLSTTWGSKIKKIKNYLANLPKIMDEQSVINNRFIIERVFNINSLTPSPVQQKMIAIIDELKALEEKNEATLNFINIPYDFEKNDDFWMLLLKVMDLS